jgi:hypothetical protein
VVFNLLIPTSCVESIDEIPIGCLFLKSFSGRR